MGFRKKQQANEFLASRNWNELAKWAGETKACLRVLFSVTYDEDPLIRWRAIEGVGVVSKVVAEDDVEKVRAFIRGLFWLMNDESGGIGWHAPEAIAEICFNVPALGDEYADLLPLYLDEEPFEEGTHAAMARLAKDRPKLIKSIMDRLKESLADPNPTIRAWTAIALETACHDVSVDALETVKDDETSVDLYDFDSGVLKSISVKDYSSLFYQ